MGHHAVNPELYGSQFPSGKMDPLNPPIILLNANKQVIGVEWEATNLGQGAPILFDQTVNLGPPHPHAEQPHYMLHAFFRPDGKVLFGDFDPQVSCPTMATSLLKTGDGLSVVPTAVLVAVLLASSGWFLKRRKA